MDTVIKDFELERWRSLPEAKDFIEEVILRIDKNYENERKPYRLSQGNYKNFTEEYRPIFRYLEYKYGLNKDIKYRHVGVGNQGFDAEIEFNNKIKEIEIAYPLLGMRSKQFELQMVDKRSAHEIYDPEELFMQINNVILETAKKKAIKQYGDTLLLIYYPFSEDLLPGDVGLPEMKFGQMVDSLKEISFGAKQVDFFVPAYNYSDIYGDQCKPARLYQIR